ncbi:hypothetical protein ACLX1H_007804 [Fusarium chlamydosporum]
MGLGPAKEPTKDSKQIETERLIAERSEEALNERKSRELTEKIEAERKGLKPQDPSPDKQVPEVEPLNPKLEKSPENPR